MTPVDKVLSIAAREVGYHEKASNAQLDDPKANPGTANYTKYARDLANVKFYHTSKQGLAWCDQFYDWSMLQAFGTDLASKMTGQPIGGYGAGCTESANYYRNIGRFYKSNPQNGDQIFFSSDGGKTMTHTGIVERVANGMVYTIEGNTSDKSGVVANGYVVARKSYSLSYARIGGYGRPKWELAPQEKEDDEMDVEGFKELMKQYRKELQDNDAGSYSEEARKWVVENGIITGGSSTEFNGMWQDFLTREQMATILYRFAKLMGRA